MQNTILIRLAQVQKPAAVLKIVVLALQDPQDLAAQVKGRLVRKQPGLQAEFIAYIVPRLTAEADAASH